MPCLPVREVDAHKGRFGLALVVGGSRGMAGAVALAGMAALRSGAGLVRLAVPDVCLETVAGFEPAYMTVPLASDRAGRIAFVALAEILRQAGKATVVACGPGMGRSLGLDALVARLFTALDRPMVIDADGLNALARRPQALGRPAGARVLTPHPGEFARLCGEKPAGDGQRADAAARLARRIGAVVVLKGHRTVITDGVSTAINSTGNPGMATGGTGDVLTGLVAGLLSQGLPALDAARLAVYLHGLAGDLAARRLGEESLVAGDLLRLLPDAFRQYREARSE
ncbi:MAG: NAD(P)H-hydrate dehydratase [Planctomycetota bacterium]|nr:NAD(P)H-hydrate dehydratase [Planctomycetota bacterium]